MRSVLLPLLAAFALCIGCGDSSSSTGEASTSGSGASATTTSGSGGSGAAGGNSGNDCPPAGEGYAEGQIAENWTLQDRDGNDVELYDFCGKVVYIEDGAEW